MSQYFSLKVNGNYVKILFDQVQYIEAADKYAKFVTEKGTYTAMGNLYHIEEQLPSDQFCRVHRSHIISLRHVSHFCSETAFVAGVELSISKQYRENFYSRMNILNIEGNGVTRAIDKPAFLVHLVVDPSLMIFVIENILAK